MEDAWAPEEDAFLPNEIDDEASVPPAASTAAFSDAPAASAASAVG